jgi:hypothetical protein
MFFTKFAFVLIILDWVNIITWSDHILLDSNGYDPITDIPI